MMNIYKKINMIGVHWEMQFLGGRGSRKKQDIAELPKSGKYRQFADLRGSWRKRRWCFWERVDTPMLPMCSFHGRYVSVRETGNIAWYVFHNALLVMNSIGYYVFKLHMFSKVTLNPSCRFLSFILVGI